MNTKKQKKTIKKLLLLALIIYLILLSYYLFFSDMLGRGAIPEGYSGLNLVPFSEISRYIFNWQTVGVEYMLLNIFGNIIIFMPIGFLFPVLIKWLNRVYKTTLLGFLISLAIELLQLKFSVGVFDVDDIILNTLGTFVGYIVYKCVKRALTEGKNEKQA